MSDPNADLIGYEFDGDRGRLRVMESWTTVGDYVVCEYVDLAHLPESMRRTVRRASQLRRRIELHSGSSSSPLPPAA